MYDLVAFMVLLLGKIYYITIMLCRKLCMSIEYNLKQIVLTQIWMHDLSIEIP